MRGSSSAARGLLFGGLLFLASVAHAGLNQWTDVGPAEGAGAFAIDPTDSAVLYGGTSTGIQKSTDGGATWTALTVGITAPFTQIGIDPDNPALLYAASNSGGQFGGGATDGIYRSRDSGQSWTYVRSTRPVGSTFSKIRSLSVGSSVVFAGIERQSCVFDFCMSGKSVTLRSADGGATWTEVGPDFPALAFSTDPVSPSTMYMGTGRVSSFFGSFSGGLFRSLDGGLRWHARNRGIALSTSGSILSVAVAPSAPSVLYAGSDEAGVFKSTDGAANWTSMNGGLGGLGNLDVRALAVDPVASSRVYAGTDTGVFVSDDGASLWVSYGPGAGISQLSLDPADRNTIYAIADSRLLTYTFGASPCLPGDRALCLNGGRFRVEVDWRAVNQGTSGQGHAVELTSDTGAFWFFQETNYELMFKVLDATSFSGYYWVFYGALSDVEYTIRVTDTQTGTTKSYFNPQGNLASHADTSAFPGSSGAPLRTAPAAKARLAASGAAGCQTEPTVLCLTGSRFRVEVSWQTDSGSGVGTAVPLTSDSGSFWFFQESNLELMVKVLDARAIDGHFWVFYGALSDVAYTITITDTESGAVRTYENPAGTLASVADTSAF
jgi:hypothetical protein